MREEYDFSNGVRGVILPKKMHRRLKRQARKKGLTGKRKKAYIYGTMSKRHKKKRGKKK